MKRALASVLTIALVITLLPLFSTNVSAADVTINGSVIDGDGDPLGGVEITATPASGTAVTATSNAAGKFSLTLTVTGTFTFSFDKAGFGLRSSFDILNSNRELAIDGSEGTVTLNIVMGPAYGGITGYVKNVNGQGLGDAAVRILDGDKVVNHTTTDGNGFYSFDKDVVSDRVLIGTYSVHVTRSDHEEMTKNNIEVTEGVNTVVNFSLESRENSYIFGLDLPHSLMLGGLFIGVFMLIAVSIHRKRLGERLLGPEEDVPEDESHDK